MKQKMEVGVNSITIPEVVVTDTQSTLSNIVREYSNKFDEHDKAQKRVITLWTEAKALKLQALELIKFLELNGIDVKEFVKEMDIIQGKKKE